MSLGIYDRLWELLEADCTELDLLLAKHTSGAGIGTGTTYDNYVTALRKREGLKDSLAKEENRATSLEQLVTFFSLTLQAPSSNQQLTIIRQEASKARLAVGALVCTNEINQINQ
jgi:hypothetical protein